MKLRSTPTLPDLPILQMEEARTSSLHLQFRSCVKITFGNFQSQEIIKAKQHQYPHFPMFRLQSHSMYPHPQNRVLKDLTSITSPLTENIKEDRSSRP
jgi:hypothetical protein